MSALKDLRLEKELTQRQAAEILGVSLRSYKSYENDTSKQTNIKYKYFMNELGKINVVDETHGILKLDDIEKKCKLVFDKYKLEFCFLFGSYAKGTAGEESDVDLLVSGNPTGLKFYGFVEEIRQILHKNVDVLGIEQLKDNFELTNEILRDGIKIYGKQR